MRLFIAEKPDLAKVIAEGLGNGQRKGGYIECGADIVTWCIGHLLQLAPPEHHNPKYADWVAADLPLKLRPAIYVPIEKTQDQLAVVCALIEQASEIVHAGDPDEEGQLLVDEVLEYVGNTRPVKRLLINDMNANAARKAMANMVDNSQYFGLSQKAKARSIGDQLYGFNMTRAYTLAGQAKGIRGVLAVGRVQTVILALIVARFKAYTGHSAAFFFSVFGKFDFDGKSITAKFQPPAGAPVDSKKRIVDEAFTADIVKACQQQVAQVTVAKVEDKRTAPPLPFSLLDLQAQMSQDHGINAEKTLAITQALRENHKAISYNRSDCNYLSDEQYDEAPETLAVLASALPDLAGTFACVDSERKSRAFDDSKISAHTAIIPTAVRIDLDNLTTEERAVYLAIVKQYVAQFLPDKQYRSAKVQFEVAGNEFVARGKKVTVPGWMALINDAGAAEDGEEGDDSDVTESPFDVLESLATGASGQCESLAVSKEKTKPLPLYTESTLLKDLRQVSKYVTDPRIKKLLLSRDEGKDKNERGGIGTPATRGAMLAKLLERNYYGVDNNKLIPTKLGLQFHDALPSIATKPDMTALWHEQQQLIESGELTCDAFLDELEAFIVEQINAVDLGSVQGFNVTAKCPMCGGVMAPRGNVVACEAEPCEFKVFREVCGKELSEEQMHQLLTTARTGVIKGMRGHKEGSKPFDASLKLTAEGKVEFVFPKTKAAAKKRA